MCGSRVSEWCETHQRTIRDIVGGKWSHTTYGITRRYCKKCRKKQAPPIKGALPSELYGTNIISMFVFLRCLGISFEHMQEIIHTLHGVYVQRSVIVQLCHKAAMMLNPVRENILEDIKNSPQIGGDETGWFLNGVNHWVWIVVTKTSAYYHISQSRSKMVIEAIMGQFEGITLSDSYPGWNDIGLLHQRCLLHYFRDMYRTLQNNASAEYCILFNKLYDILHDAIDTATCSPEEVKCFLYRIDEIIGNSWQDSDCTRYVKRLKREREQLFTFLTNPVDYHNNASERGIRCISRMRKILYGSRSESGIETTETLMTVYSTCKLRDVNFYKFVKQYLDGDVQKIPMPETVPETVPEIAAA